MRWRGRESQPGLKCHRLYERSLFSGQEAEAFRWVVGRSSFCTSQYRCIACIYPCARSSWEFIMSHRFLSLFWRTGSVHLRSHHFLVRHLNFWWYVVLVLSVLHQVHIALSRKRGVLQTSTLLMTLLTAPFLVQSQHFSLGPWSALAHRGNSPVTFEFYRIPCHLDLTQRAFMYDSRYLCWRGPSNVPWTRYTSGLFCQRWMEGDFFFFLATIFLNSSSNTLIGAILCALMLKRQRNCLDS